jgi:hypothetical protein
VFPRRENTSRIDIKQVGHISEATPGIWTRQVCVKGGFEKWKKSYGMTVLTSELPSWTVSTGNLWIWNRKTNIEGCDIVQQKLNCPEVY